MMKQLGWENKSTFISRINWIIGTSILLFCFCFCLFGLFVQMLHWWMHVSKLMNACVKKWICIIIIIYSSPLLLGYQFHSNNWIEWKLNAKYGIAINQSTIQTNKQGSTLMIKAHWMMNTNYQTKKHIGGSMPNVALQSIKQTHWRINTHIVGCPQCGYT